MHCLPRRCQHRQGRRLKFQGLLSWGSSYGRPSERSLQHLCQFQRTRRLASALSKHRRVYRHTHRWRAFAEYVVVDPAFYIKIPDTLSIILAAPLACAGITVWGGIIRSFGQGLYLFHHFLLTLPCIKDVFTSHFLVQSYSFIACINADDIYSICASHLDT
jgi:hypothetical protein